MKRTPFVNKLLEKDIQYSILQFLRLKRLFCWKNSTVGIYKKSTGSYIPSQNVGSPDIFLVNDGTIWGIEVKTPKGKQSDNQKAWQNNFEAVGGRYLLARSLEDVQKETSLWF